jgi:surface antigen
MLDGYDAAERPVRTGECPSQTTADLGVGTIDHVFVSKNITVTGWHRIENRQVTASDHGVTYIDAQLPGTPATHSKHASKLGVDIGVNSKQKVGLLPVSQQNLAGILRLSITTPNGGTSPGSDFVGNDGFPGGECVKYVEYILNRHSSKYHYQVDITTGAHGVAASTVADNLGSTLGYTVNHTPAIHATVSFPGPPYGEENGVFFGHVALVAQINKDGSIVVEESNWTNHDQYGAHTVPASQVPQLTYAHTEDGWH